MVSKSARRGEPARLEPERGGRAHAAPATGESRNPGALLIVGIGASAGGLDAFKTFLAHTPANSGMAFVLVQHLSPDHKSMLAELLGAVTAMRVVEATDGVEVAANCVFVISPDSTLMVREGRLEVVHPAPPRDRRRPIDTFFQSLAEDQGENAIGVILSGTGSDGSAGVALVKEHGGLTLAQAEFDSHAMSGMPQSAASTGQVDEILAVEAMPARIVAYRDHLMGVAASKGEDGTRKDAVSHLSTITAALRMRSGHDFGEYKEKTLVRRLQRRMQVPQIGTPEAYIERYRQQPEELDLLFREILIGVTEFFRDPAAFEALAEEVLKPLARGRGPDDEIRVWVPGCGTGQEVFSIAILLREAMNAVRPRPKVQIFGTDIDERAIAVARLGRYRRPLVGVSAERIERWFVEEGRDACVAPEIRDMCVFSTHSLIKHPPFSKLDLISCRNLLIYLEASLQNRVMWTFHYALKPGGRLFLGSSESVARATRLFGVVDKKYRIFARREVEAPRLPQLTAAARRPEPPSAPAAKPKSSAEWIDKAVRRTADKHTPPHVVIDGRDQIVRFSGPAMGRYVELPPGAPSFALFDILRKNLRPAVRALLKEARSVGDIAVLEGVPVRLDGRSLSITMIAEPLTDGDAEAGIVVLFFRDAPLARPGPRPAPDDPDSAGAYSALEQELRTTRAQLQSTIDELEVANEELKSSNEEHQSVNEELQSSNEELETAKEEMQSVNEEMYTVNAELINKNAQLTHLNSDLKNLMESTQIATLFLDDVLRIRSFTPGIRDVFPLRESDLGRPITEIIGLLDYAGLGRDVRVVLRHLTPVERQVSLKDGGKTFILSIRPYRTLDNVIEGVVLTFVDITERNAVDQTLRDTEAYLRLLVDSVADAVYCVDREGATTLCNAAFLRQLGYHDEKEVIGVRMHDRIHHSHADGAPHPAAQCPILRTARTGEPAHEDGDVFFRVDGTSFPVEYWARPIVRGGELQGAVCTFVDVSERRRSEEQQSLLVRELDHRVKNLFAVVGGMVTLSARSATTSKEVAERIQGRLGALAVAHGLASPRPSATGGGRRETTLGELIGTILAPHLERPGADNDPRVEIDGPELVVGGDAVANLALVLHELATNASKYGAFSTPGGRVRVSWTVEKRRLALTWEERGGPVIETPPGHEGFGSLLARRSVNGQLAGDLVFRWDRAGLVVELSAATEHLAP